MVSYRNPLSLFDDYYNMMSDRVRFDAYARAIATLVKPGDIVIDLGSGPGLLSLLAAQAGAEKVYAIEKTNAAKLAVEIAKANDFQDRIEVVAENSKNFEIPVRADVLVSETLGSFAVDENTLDFTLDARERLLKPDAILIPRRLAMWMAPTSNTELRKKADFWTEVGGFDFSPARKETLRQMNIADVASDELLASPQLFASVDLRRHQRVALEKKLRFEIDRQGTIHGVAGWFQAELADDIVIDTAPTAPATHWKQACFPFQQPIDAISGDCLEFALNIGPASELDDDANFFYELWFSQSADE